MDPFTSAAVVYIATKIGEKVLDKILEKGIEYSVESIVPAQTFEERLRVVIQDTVEEYNQGKPNNSERLLPFYDTQIMFSKLISDRVYGNGILNPLNVEDFRKENILLPTEEDLSRFFDLFINNVKQDKQLRKLFVEEYYKEAIFAIRETVSDIHSKIDNISNKNKVEILLTRSKINNQKKHQFNFRQRSVPFVGRESELNLLREFFNKTDTLFSWWVVTGLGGVGKSRLVLELCEELYRDNVNAGFLDYALINNIDVVKWVPEKDHLIVIDYVDSGYVYIRRFLNILASRNDIKHKVKVLIIEREFENDAAKRLLNDYNISSYLYSNSECYIQGMGANELGEIVKSIVKDKDRIGNDVGAIVSQVDSKNRPLFAMFIGYAIENGQHVRDWNQDNLLDYQLDYEFNLVKEKFSEYSDEVFYEHKNLLTIATIAYGLTQENLDTIFDQNITWLPKRETLDVELYRALSGWSQLEETPESREMHKYMHITHININNNTRKEVSPFNRVLELHPILPDVLGEYYALKNLQPSSKFKYRDRDKLEKIKEISEAASDYHYSSFVRRVLLDFPLHESILPLMKRKNATYMDMRGMYAQEIIHVIKWLYSKGSEPAILERLRDYTRELYENSVDVPIEQGFIDDPERVYMEATQMVIYSYKDNIEKQLELYNLVKERSDIFINNTNKPIFASNPENSILHDSQAMSYLKDGFPSKESAEQHLKRYTAIFEGIPYIEVCSINAIVESHKEDSEKRDKLVSLLERLRYINKVCFDPRIRVMTLKTYGEFGLERAAFLDGEVLLMYNLIKEAPVQVDPINSYYELATYFRYMSHYFIKNDRERVDYFDDVTKFLRERQPTPKVGDALIELANIAYHFCLIFHDQGNIDFADIFHIRVGRIRSFFLPQVPPFVDAILAECIKKRVEIMHERRAQSI